MKSIFIKILHILLIALILTPLTNALTTEPYKLGTMSYIFNTADNKLRSDINKLCSELQLDKETIKTLKHIAQYESQKINYLKNLDYKYRNMNNQKKIEEYKDALNNDLILLNSDVTFKLKKLLGEQKYSDFIHWLNEWWPSEVEYRNKMKKIVNNVDFLGITSCYVFATQFELDDLGVALPDKYIKFANLGWNIPKKYKKYYSKPPYRVEVERNKIKEEFDVVDVGPWNEDDNYWDLPEWLNIGSGPYRRTFDELSMCMPEARAAFERNYNNGLDQFDRTVLNPAGIDLTIEAAKLLGLDYLENAWVTIYIDNLP
jgi:hypothetical protein